MYTLRFSKEKTVMNESITFKQLKNHSSDFPLTELGNAIALICHLLRRMQISVFLKAKAIQRPVDDKVFIILCYGSDNG